MAVLFLKFQRALKKALSFKTSKATGSYENLESEEGEKPSFRKGYAPILVGEDDEPKMLYEVPLATMNSPAFFAMLNRYRDEYMISGQTGPMLVPCSAMTFERVLETIK